MVNECAKTSAGARLRWTKPASHRAPSSAAVAAAAAVVHGLFSAVSIVHGLFSLEQSVHGSFSAVSVVHGLFHFCSRFVLERALALSRSRSVPLLFTVRSRAHTRSETFSVCSTSVLLEHSVHRSFSFDAHCSRQHQWSYSIIAVTGCKRFCGIDSALSEHSIAVDDGYGIGVCVCHQRAEIVVDIAERLW